MSPLLNNHPYKAGKSGEGGILAQNILWPEACGHWAKLTSVAIE